MNIVSDRRKSSELNKNRSNGGKQPVEKQNITKWKQQKETTVKPCKPLVADHTPTRVMKPNMDRKLQNYEKPVFPKRQVAPQQHVSYHIVLLFLRTNVTLPNFLLLGKWKQKPTSSDGETVQDKLEATKRKLQERYQQAENGLY